MIFKYFIIGLIQGLTEFLPVSSSGHIVLFGELFNLDCDIILLSVVAHIGTLLSVLIYMRKPLKDMLLHPFCDTNKKLIISTIPAVICVVCFKKIIDKLYGLQFLLYGFLITGILLILCDLKQPKYEKVTKKHAIYMGIMQGVAILPGISRSGSTMAVGMMSGLKKEVACEYTFLMSIPIILGSAIYEIMGLLKTTIGFNFWPLLTAFLSSFIFGLLSIKIMMKILKKNKLYYFSIYTIILSIITLFIIIR